MSRTESSPLTVVVSLVRSGPLGGAIFTGKDTNGVTHRLVADSAAITHPPVEGEVWAVTGYMELHTKYGTQMRVTSGLPIRPSGKLIVNYLANNHAFKGTGIGKKKAERLWEEFNEELYDILSEADVTRLSRVLTSESAQRLTEAWKRTQTVETAEVFQFLSQYDFDPRLASKVRRVWPVDTVRKILENPYRMLAFSDWRNVDAAAKRLGVKRDDPRRLVAAVEACLYRGLDAKHTVLSKEAVLGRVFVALGVKDREVAEAALELAVKDYAVVPSSQGYQPQGAATMERVIAERLRGMCRKSTSYQPNLFSVNLSSLITESVSTFEAEEGIDLNADQKAAVEVVLSNQFSVLTGGAGTGKTTVLKIIHDVCERAGKAVIQMALSGRAAHRMRETTGRDALTIAKFLHASGANEFNLGNDSLFIVDESSMIDLPSTYSIIRTLPPQASLLLVGDPYQLPPIGFGLVFQILANSSNVPRVELVRIHRQAESSGIPRIAHDIRHGNPPEMPSFAGPELGASFIEARDDEIIDALIAVKSSFASCGEVQILGVTKRGLCGVNIINSVFQNLCSEGGRKTAGGRFAEGDPIIYLTNDYQKNLWNGSLGRVESVGLNPTESRGYQLTQTIVCSFDGVTHEFSEEDFRDIDLAYAITVHKAQGSQFQRVVIPVVYSRLLDRTLLYTALTRGIEQVVFIGDRNIFERAIKAPPTSHERVVGFSL